MQNKKTRTPGARLSSKRRDIPDGIWAKCSACGDIIYNGELSRNLKICPRCDYYFPLEPAERIALLADKGSFLRYDAGYQSPICPDVKICDRTIITGEVTLSGHRLVIAVANLCADTVPRVPTDAATGLFVCEEIIAAVLRAADQHLPVLLVYTNIASIQVQDDMFIPAQALSIGAAMNRLAREKLLYVSILAHSDSRGYFPGFACTADIVIAESNIPGIARAGRRTGQSEAIQAAQALLQNGMVDTITPRRELKHTLTDILNFFC